MITDNTARKTAGSISNVEKKLIIKDSLLKNNTSQEGMAPIINDSEGSIRITNSIIEENTTNID